MKRENSYATTTGHGIGVIFIIILFILMFLTQKIFSQDYTTKPDYPLQISGKIAFLSWSSQELAESYGKMLLLGAGIEKQISSDIKCCAGFGIGKTNHQDCTLTYSEIKSIIQLNWFKSRLNNPNFITGFGGKIISLEKRTPAENKSENKFAFLLKAGINVPLWHKTNLELGGEYATINVKETLNPDNVQLYTKLIFNIK